MEDSAIALLLLVVGLVLLVAEFFIPSGGMIFVVSMICCTGSIWFAWRAWWESSPGIWWTYITSLVVLIPTAVVGALYVFPRTAVGRRILLEAPSHEEVTPYAEDEERLSQLVGRTGKTLTLLTPGGLVLVDGERMHCESEGMLIDPNQEVEIIDVKANRLVVRQWREHEPPSEPDDDPLVTRNDPDDDPRLDFDVPQS